MKKLTKLRHEAASSPSGTIKVSIEALNEIEAENARLREELKNNILRIYAWLGANRDKMFSEVVTLLQDLLEALEVKDE